ncbi:hypothetical protein ACA040_002063 [Xenophilus aerolatus]
MPTFATGRPAGEEEAEWEMMAVSWKSRRLHGARHLGGTVPEERLSRKYGLLMRGDHRN